MRQNIAGSSSYEPIIGYSRAVRIGNTLHISGTGPAGLDTANADAAAQTRHVFGILQGVLQQAGATLENVVRTRIYLAHVEDWEAVGRVHGEFFGTIRPATTMIAVQLLDPTWRIEIEVEAVIPAKES